jgi:hypothetical protein
VALLGDGLFNMVDGHPTTHKDAAVSDTHTIETAAIFLDRTFTVLTPTPYIYIYIHTHRTCLRVQIAAKMAEAIPLSEMSRDELIVLGKKQELELAAACGPRGQSSYGATPAIVLFVYVGRQLFVMDENIMKSTIHTVFKCSSKQFRRYEKIADSPELIELSLQGKLKADLLDEYSWPKKKKTVSELEALYKQLVADELLQKQKKGATPPIINFERVTICKASQHVHGGSWLTGDLQILKLALRPSLNGLDCDKWARATGEELRREIYYIVDGTALEDEPRVIGCLRITGETPVVEHGGVHPQYQGQGLESLLLARVFADFEKESRTMVRLHSTKDVAARLCLKKQCETEGWDMVEAEGGANENGKWYIQRKQSGTFSCENDGKGEAKGEAERKSTAELLDGEPFVVGAPAAGATAEAVIKEEEVTKGKDPSLAAAAAAVQAGPSPRKRAAPSPSFNPKRVSL